MGRLRPIANPKHLLPFSWLHENGLFGFGNNYYRGGSTAYHNRGKVVRMDIYRLNDEILQSVRGGVLASIIFTLEYLDNLGQQFTPCLCLWDAIHIKVTAFYGNG